MPTLAPQVLLTPHSGIRRMSELADGIQDPLMLVGGDPNFSTPSHIVDAAAAAARAGATGYSPGAGIAALRSAIAAKVTQVNGRPTSWTRCVSRPGAAVACSRR